MTQSDESGRPLVTRLHRYDPERGTVQRRLSLVQRAPRVRVLASIPLGRRRKA